MACRFPGTKALRLPAAISILLLSSPVQAAQIDFAVRDRQHTAITLSGEIASGDAERLNRLLAAAGVAGRPVAELILDSPGGLLLEGIKLAALVHEARLRTAAPRLCASACFVVFAAGAEKVASATARIGIHGASDARGRSVGDATIAMAKAVRNLGVPPGIIGKMVVTSPQEMVWLSPADLKDMDVRVDATVAASKGRPADAESGRKWDELTVRARLLSSRQHGEARTTSSCNPAQTECVVGTTYQADGQDFLVRTTTRTGGGVVKRDICQVDAAGETRVCKDWDTGVVVRAIRRGADWVDLN